MYVGCCYRPPTPNNSANFIDDLTSKIHEIPSSIPIVLAGDSNYNLLRIDHDRDASSFLDAMLSVGLINTITKPTRELNDSISLIDNIFISISLNYSSGIFPWDISDHFAIFTFINNFFSFRSEVETISYRLVNELTISNLRNAFSTTDFTSILQTENIDFAVNMLDSIIQELYDQNCPIITKRITKKDREKPWITDNLKRLISTRQTYRL